MPPKDDDDPKSTKEVVTKKQKQMLNREELDLSLIAEAFGGLLLEKSQDPTTKAGREELLRRERSGSLFDPKSGYDPAFPTDEDEQERIRRQESNPIEDRPGRRKKERSTGRIKVTRASFPDPYKARAESDFQTQSEKDAQQGKFPGSTPGGEEGKKTFKNLMKDILKTKPSTTTNVSNVPQRVRQQQAQQYREAGGGRRGQYLRRTGRLPDTSNPAEPKPAPAAAKPAPSTPKQQYTLKNLQRDVVRGLNVASNIPLLGQTPVGRALKIGATASPFLLGVGAELARVSRDMNLAKVKERELEALKPIKKGTTISVMNPLTGKVEQLTQAEYEKRTGKRTSVVAPPAPAAAPAAAPPKTPVIAPPITGIPRGRGGDQTTPGAPQRPKRDKKGDFQFQPPGGLNLYLGRRQNPQ